MNDVEEKQKIWAIAKSARVGILTLQDEAGAMNARPMASVIPDEEELIGFVTDRNSPKMSEAREGGDALLTYSNMSAGEYLVLRGRISVVEDRQKLKSLWTTADEIFFPDGPGDSRAVLLKFEPADAEYWSGGAGAIKLAVKYVQMKLSGKRPSVGEHRHVNL